MTLRLLRGAEAVLARHTRSLPQPDQLCGPFSASVALAALTDGGADPTEVTDLARASGTHVLQGDHADWRPAGAPLLTTGWDQLPTTDHPDESGTDAAGLVDGLARVRPDVAVVPAAGSGDVVSLLLALAEGRHHVGVLANLRTGPVAPPGVTWDVGHFVVLWGVDPDAGTVALADTYAELGADGWPRGCRPVDGAALSEALADRGLLLLCRAGETTARSLPALVTAHGFGPNLWST